MTSILSLVKQTLGRAAARTSFAVFILAVSCLDPYPPPVSNVEVNYLVVDGFLNSADGLARVKLSRALPLETEGSYPTVGQASVQVEKEDGSVFTLFESTPGIYSAVRSDLQVGSSYKLIIHTPDAKRYESDFVTLKQSPALEDVSWTQEAGGITIHVDTRDPSGSTRYYQWLYTETWEYDADKQSGFFVRNGFAVSRQAHERIDICYSTVASSKVLIGTTRDQSGDFINDYPLVFIPAGSKKLSRHYSILVQQRALDETSYNYWLQLQRTNENLGGLFDPLPTRVTGNIHRIDDSELVLGYFSGGGVEEKRIYIDPADLPEELRVVNRAFCPVDSVPSSFINNFRNGDALIAPYGTPIIIGYTLSTNSCMDCRSEGGVLTKPSFWPY
jgi:hypothetical protein